MGFLDGLFCRCQHHDRHLDEVLRIVLRIDHKVNTLEGIVMATQEQLDTLVADLGAATESIKNEITALEAQVAAAGVSLDLSGLQAAVEALDAVAAPPAPPADPANPDA